ncbi:MAG TPA: SlyX protein, partial [Porticoccaceae bacterium]|nr:SlyX protein [Porticoccaceae bacterium]
MSDARVEALEVKVAFQEDLLNALNDVVVRQDQRIDSLEKSLENYRRRLEG